MTKHEWIEIGALGVGALALFVILSRGSSQSGATNEQGGSSLPPYLTYNQNNPGYSPPTDNSALNLPGLGSSGASPCNCGGSNNTITFSDTGSFASTLGQQLGIDLGQYENAVLNQFPDYVRQYFNLNTQSGPDIPVSTKFASFAGG